MIDRKTPHLQLPLPNEENELDVDVQRIKTSLALVDENAGEQDAALKEHETRVDALETSAADHDNRVACLEEDTTRHETAVNDHERRVAGLERTAADHDNRVDSLEQESATHATRDELYAHNLAQDAHDALVKKITVGSLSPVVGVALVETGGGAGLWFNVDMDGTPISPTRRYWDYHPVYNSLRRVLVDSQVMVEHKKFYYKAMTLPSGPLAGKHARFISPGPMEGFKPFPSFMRAGAEIPAWYCGAYSATDEGGTPKKLGSRPGKMPFVNVDFPTMKSYCRNRNVDGVENFSMWNIYQLSEIQLLYLLEYATPDSQATCGRGRVDTSSAANVDATDVATASWRGHCGLWGNVWEMVDGLDITPAGNIRMFKDDGSEEWVDTGRACLAYNGSAPQSIVTLQTGGGSGYSFDDVFFPASQAVAETAGTFPDKFWGRNGSAGNVLYSGGAWGHASGAGLFCLSLCSAASIMSVSIGVRLAKQ